MIVVIFRSRLRPQHADEYTQVAAKIDALAHSMPGFLGIQSYAGADGERVSISTFADEASLRAWREHPEHVAAQKLGREKFYSEYRVQVCELTREYSKVPSSPRDVL